MAGRTILKDVADEAGVSVMTASRALRGIGRVNAETRRRVLEVAISLGYQRHVGQVFPGFGNATPSDHNLRVVMPAFKPSSFGVDGSLGSRIVSGLRDVLAQNGGILKIIEADDLEDFLKKFPRVQTHGIVLRQVLPNSWLRKLQELAPVVYAISHDVQPGVDCVYFNEFKSATMIYDLLLSRGHKHFAWVTPNRSNPLSNIDYDKYDLSSGFDRQAFNFTYARYASWRALDLGIEEDPVKHEYIVHPLHMHESERKTDSKRTGEEAAKAILKLKKLPTAVISGADDLAIPMLEYLEKEGINIPEDMSVVTYLHSDVKVRMKKRMSGVRLPFGQVGRIIPEIIQRRITHPEASYFSVALETELLDRGTVANAPGHI
ncbi:LacI family DNA-binding transcriptional regulator [Rubellicoccus peritrichatus]|uniref:LacI family DNA-binding transcriptional regulator n=1 Tax=Rubellicoccus peritrichatus TaxID=3080537 RepID=A0AAQ3LGE9_9BACT|nr:LacI family DNA-binding transcriptional regulator [Puniceicoccus sp. CR14]WOO43405.1 LacI family DNA-binding transcriptional regulator [Puniceicoccus sp. CR14]